MPTARQPARGAPQRVSVPGLLHPLRLLIPALIPSWNFFDWIAPSPRIEFALSSGAGPVAEAAWLEFRPRPARETVPAMAGRLLFNPRWNETLYVISCAERLIADRDAHGRDEVFRRIAADLPAGPGGAFLRFRLVLLRRDGDTLRRDTCFVSEARSLDALRAR